MYVYTDLNTHLTVRINKELYVNVSFYILIICSVKVNVSPLKLISL